MTKTYSTLLPQGSRPGRRNALKLGLAGALASTLSRAARAQGKTALKLAIWGDKTSEMAHRNVIARYEQARPDVTIKLEVTPFGQFYQQIDTRLAGRQAPDMFRMQYQQVGRYANGRTVVDLAQFLPTDYGSAFVPAIWHAVSNNGKTFAMPYHTDTIALFYNTDCVREVRKSRRQPASTRAGVGPNTRMWRAGSRRMAGCPMRPP